MDIVDVRSGNDRQFAIGHGDIVSSPIINGDFPWLRKRLPEGNVIQWRSSIFHLEFKRQVGGVFIQ